MPYFETSDGAKIHFEEQGTGQPLVLLHGWTCSTVFWQRNAPELAKNFRVVTMDLRGHGNSSKILHGHTIAQYARDVGELLEHLDLQDTTLGRGPLAGADEPVQGPALDGGELECRLHDGDRRSRHRHATFSGPWRPSGGAR